MGVPVARVEFMDAASVRAVNLHSKLTLRETPLLVFEFHGSPAGVQEQAETVQAITAEHGGMDFEWAERPEDRSRLWTARHNAYFAGLQLRPVVAPAPPTSACQSRAWPIACAKPSMNWTAPASRTPSWATWATATSTC